MMILSGLKTPIFMLKVCFSVCVCFNEISESVSYFPISGRREKETEKGEQEARLEQCHYRKYLCDSDDLDCTLSNKLSQTLHYSVP